MTHQPEGPEDRGFAVHLKTVIDQIEYRRGYYTSRKVTFTMRPPETRPGYVARKRPHKSKPLSLEQRERKARKLRRKAEKALRDEAHYRKMDDDPKGWTDVVLNGSAEQCHKLAWGYIMRCKALERGKPKPEEWR